MHLLAINFGSLGELAKSDVAPVTERRPDLVGVRGIMYGRPPINYWPGDPDTF